MQQASLKQRVFSKKVAKIIINSQDEIESHHSAGTPWDLRLIFSFSCNRLYPQ
jgi:hypothetical protein